MKVGWKLSLAIYRLLSRCYPPGMRREYGREMEEAFLARLGETSSPLALTVRESTSTVMAALRVRAHSRVHFHRKLRRPSSTPTERLMQDIKHAFQSLRRAPGFTLIAVLTLGLGIGATTAIFSVVDSVLLSELPYDDPEELVLVWNRTGAGDRMPNSAPELLDYRQRATLLEGFSGVFSEKTNLTGYGTADLITLGHTNANFFDILGVNPELGRFFVAAEDLPRDRNVFTDPTATIPPSSLVLSYGFWQSKFGGDPDVIGTSLYIDGAPMNIVGVTPPGFDIYMPEEAGFPMGIQAWTTLQFDFTELPREGLWLTVVSRLKDGATVEQAQEEMNGIAAQLREEYQFHEESGIEIEVASLHGEAVRHVEPILLALLAAVGLVMLIASSNVANLMLLRVAGRERELAVRSALGSSGWRITSLLGAESLLLALLAAGAGLAIAVGGIRLLLLLQPENLPRLDTIGIDGRVLFFTLTVAALAAVFVTVVPALRVRGGRMFERLQQGSRGSSASRHRVQGALVVTQVAFSVVLLVGTALILRSFILLVDVDPGFEPTDLVTVSASLPFFDYRDPNARGDFYEQALDRIREIPGVQSAGGTVVLPLAEGNGLLVTPYALAPGDEESWNRNRASYRLILPGYMESMGTRVLQGRALTAADNRTREDPVALVDERLARELWPAGDALDQIVYVQQFGDDFATIERVPARVVGVVENVRHTTLYQAGLPAIYVPHRQWTDQRVTFTIRTALPASAIGEQVREVVQGMNPNVPVYAVRDMEQFVARATSSTTFVLTLGSIFAGVALVLASVGLFGVVSYSVRQRTREIGIRMAFGARHGEVIGLVLGQGLKLSAVGVVLGLAASGVATRGLANQVYGVGTLDPLSFAAAGLLLLGVATLACYVPARRAALTDPREALAEE